MKKIGFWLLLAVLIAAFLISGWQLLSYWKESSVNRKNNEEVIDAAVEILETEETAAANPEEKPDHQAAHHEVTSTEPAGDYAPIQVNFNILHDRNEDVVAWIYSPDTKINYPIVQADDNDYYLHRMLNGEWNAGGSLFMDWQNASDFSDLNTVIYGHHMKNGSMFASLCEYKDEKYYQEHPVMYLLTPDQDYRIELVAGYLTDGNSAAYTFPMSRDQQEFFVENSRNQSTFTSDVEVQEGDRLISLSTCSYEFSGARYIVIGVLHPLDHRP